MQRIDNAVKVHEVRRQDYMTKMKTMSVSCCWGRLCV